MTLIEFKNVYKSYDDVPILEDINLNIKEGELVTVLGSSGSGKTTLLKLINGLISKNTGSIKVMDKAIEDWDRTLLRRNIGYVIQSVGLFPHLSINENINYVLKLENKEEDGGHQRSKELLSMLNLPADYSEKYPRQLSGGEQQRVGIARAIAARPEVLLMDEPFSALDDLNRKQLQVQLKELHRKLGITIILVTHDIEEAFFLGTKIVIMNKGRIEQLGDKNQYFNKLETPFVESLLQDKINYLYLKDRNIDFNELKVFERSKNNEN